MRIAFDGQVNNKRNLHGSQNETCTQGFSLGMDSDKTKSLRVDKDNGTPDFEQIVSDKRIVKISFGIPNEGTTDPMAYDNRMVMCQHMGALQVLSHFGLTSFDGVEFKYPEGVKFEFYINSIGHILTPLAREHLAQNAVETGMDYLFMVDDDMITPPDLFESLYSRDVDVIAPLAFSRNAPYHPVIYEIMEGYDSVEKSNYFINYSLKTYPKNKLVECDAIGFGAVLIKTDVLKKMKKPWFMSTCGTGEDIFFCHKARKSNAKIFVDTSVKLGHLGAREIVTEEKYENMNDTKLLRGLKGETSKYA